MVLATLTGLFLFYLTFPCEKLVMRWKDMFLEFVSFITNPDGTPKYENTVQYAILKKE